MVPAGLLVVASTAEDLLEVTPDTTAPVTMTVSSPAEEVVPEEVPYVAPVLKPKPYRN